MSGRRAFLAGALALPIAARAEGVWDAVVDPATGTLGAALAEAERAGRPFRILLRPGIFTEKLTVRAPGVTIQGSPGTVLQYGTAAGTPRPGGGSWGTGGSGTLTIAAKGVTLRGLTIRNSFDYIGARRDGAGNGAQAVALAIGRGADRTVVDRCTLLGYQDTFYLHTRTLVTGTRIVGGVDFIFGGAAAWFEGCEVVTRNVPGAEGFGFVAAPSTPAAQEFGLVFSRCRLTREPGVPDHSAWLGRPWRAGGNMALLGQAAFLDCWMDAHVRREGWTWMGYKGPEGEQRRLTPPEARLREFGTMGPGAGPASEDRRLLTAEEARRFTRSNVIGF
ncbi:pectinesterase family protein [Sphingomonas sp. HITSZ_GF]|uniref:pectinesterase family protein n=1 Tax=Sphingomonas sp. HITSZ_GF TaxID=3037247 RepID=UPI00240DC5D8|nr:pectinesterase family protein [Sphingomonas sp. HITSZ_GF]MDG2535515.1 pectinesterase family protein [Sphingomonas sp. HITSZ_GF]